ncbi:hypothetical protein AX16_004787 [Volvariella volvacea WC 439]|nr:hypothetical protein AX16_004787 [Volvariella volvacea WC 439]
MGGLIGRAIDMADEFPRAEVIGVDLSPIQPRSVPPNCTFELCDLDQWNIPYPDDHFDLIHARSMHIGIRNYPRFLSEIARLLRPGGLVLIIEPSLHPLPLYPNLTLSLSSEPSNTSANTPTNTPPATVPPSISSSHSSNRSTPLPSSPAASQSSAAPSEAPVASSSQAPPPPLPARAPRTVIPPKHHGWETFWETYRSCLRRHGIDITIPERLTELLAATEAFESITSRDGNIPVGFWPTDETMRTIGEIQWMDYELLLPALKPFFLSVGLSDGFVDKLIADAQYDLYYPPAGSCRTARIHIVHATKMYQ